MKNSIKTLLTFGLLLALLCACNKAEKLEQEGAKGKCCLANALIGYKLYLGANFEKSLIHLKKAEMHLEYCDSMCRVNKQVQNYKKCLKNSTLGEEKFNFSLGLLLILA